MGFTMMRELVHDLAGAIRCLLLVSLFAFCAAAAFAQDDNGLPEAPPDPDISDICRLSDCNPAQLCPDPDESCYSVNGVFYCCVEPPVGGMEAVVD